MLAPREKAYLLENFSPEEDGTHNTASSRTGSPTHYQQTNSPPKAAMLVLGVIYHLYSGVLATLCYLMIPDLFVVGCCWECFA